MEAGINQHMMKVLSVLALVWASLPMAFAQTQILANEEVHQPHHLALAGGVGWHDSEDSAFLGIDYFYAVSNSWGLGAFYEEVNGDFDLQAWGVLAKASWGHGFSFAFGPGYEYKLAKDKTLFLFRLQGGYSWHFGSWSVGPVITADLIEDGNSTYYAGFTVGYGW